MTIEDKLKRMQYQINVIAAAMEIRGSAYISPELESRAKSLQVDAKIFLEKEDKKHAAWDKYNELKKEIDQLEWDYPEFTRGQK